MNKGLLLGSRNNKRGITHTSVCSMFVVGMPFRTRRHVPLCRRDGSTEDSTPGSKGVGRATASVAVVGAAVVGLMMCENPVGLPHQISQLHFLCYATADQSLC